MEQSRFQAILASVMARKEEYIDVSSLLVDDEKLDILLSAMQSSGGQYKALNVSHNAITSAGARQILSFLTKHPINEVSMAGNQIDEATAQAFIALFQGEKHPHVIDLRDNKCSETTVMQLALLGKSAAYNPSIKAALLAMRGDRLTFEGQSYQDIDVKLIKFVLQSLQDVQHVDFGGCALGDNGIYTVAELLKESKIPSISVRKCGITTVGLQHFINAADLPHHAHLRELDFSENLNITNELVRQLPNLVFNTNNTLIRWNLEETSVTSEYRNIVETECALNQQPAALKAAVVAIRCGAPESHTVNFQWVDGVEECMRFMWRYIRDSQVIERLNLSNCGIVDDALALLARALERNTSLRVLDLANNSLTDAGITALFDVLQKGACGVAEVNLANNDLDDAAATAIIAALRANPKLTVINVDVNPRLSDTHVREISGLVAVNRAPPAVRLLLPLLERNAPEVTEVDFSRKDVTLNDEAVRLICRALHVNDKVRRVNLSHNMIGDLGALYIAELLAANGTITELLLAGNSIGNRGLLRFADVLRVNGKLKVLDLSDNVFDEEGAASLPDMLRANNSLYEIRLDKTRVSADLRRVINASSEFNRQPTELKAIYYRLIDGDKTFVKVNLNSGRMDEAQEWKCDDIAMEILCGALRGRSYVKSVDFTNKGITPQACKFIADMLMPAEGACNITSLRLAKNPIGDFGVAELCKAFATNKSLRDLDLTETGVTELGAELLTTALKENDQICYLTLPDGLSGPQIDEFNRAMTLQNEMLELKHLLLRLERGEAIESIELHQDPEEQLFGDVPCKLLCTALLHNQHIRSVNLANNSITLASVAHIVEMIEFCPNLAFVDLSNNKIDDTGAQVLISCVEITSHIRTINVKGNPISAEKQQRLGELLAMNLSSQKLKKVLLQHARNEPLDDVMDFNGKTNDYKLGDDEVIVLSEMLRSVQSVRALDLGNNAITDRGCTALANVLRQNHSMEALYLDGNVALGPASGEALFYALKLNPQLHTLNLDNTNIPPSIQEEILSLLHINQVPLHERVNMRKLPVEKLDDRIQFKNTDYCLAQNEDLEEEALQRCEETKHLLLE